jgi:COP9 signalosome complex subunit 4
MGSHKSLAKAVTLTANVTHPDSVCPSAPHAIMESQLAQFATLSQKDKGVAYLSLLSDILSRPDQSSIPKDLEILVGNVVNQDSVGLVVGRQVLSELVKALEERAIKDTALRKAIVQETLSAVRPRIVSYEEQVSRLLL